jgi:hypothetical protein
LGPVAARRKVLMVSQASELARLVAAFRQPDPVLDARLARGARLLVLGHVGQLHDGTWAVASEHEPGRVYRVYGRTCTCWDAARAPARWCKHRCAVGLMQAALAQVHLEEGGAPFAS